MSLPEEEDFEDNPYGLKGNAQEWLEQDMEPFGEEGNLDHESCYRPHLIDSESSIADEKLTKEAQEHLDKAATEYWKRAEKADKETIKKPIQPVLVLLGISKKKMEMLIEKEVLGSGRFLYFPTLTWRGDKEDALFVTYMPGPEHGWTDGCFAGEVYSWAKVSGLKKFLGLGTSSGGKKDIQPDLRILPRLEYRDSSTRDKDQGNKNNPHTRFYWQCEFSNLNIVNLRQHGKTLMDRTHYTRLFAGCKFTSPTQEDPDFEAAVVLWGKNDDTNVIEVLDAISFGSRELSDNSLAYFSTPEASMLPPVRNWRRPGNADACPWRPPNHWENPEPEWVLRIPIKSLLYKVKDYGTNQYLVNELRESGSNYFFKGKEITDLLIDIKHLALDMATSTGDRQPM